MHRYHTLDVAKLNRHPTTLAAFRSWLTAAFAAVKDWLEHPDGIDEADLEFCTAVVRRASQTACRLGGGQLAEPFHRQHMHASAMDVLGRMIVWCESQKPSDVGLIDGDELTINEAAQALNVHPKTVRKYIAEGVLVARDVAPPSSAHRDFRIPAAAVRELKANYRSQAVEKPHIPVAAPVRKYTPKLLAFKSGD